MTGTLIAHPPGSSESPKRRPWWAKRWLLTLATILLVILVTAGTVDKVINYPPLGSGDPGGARLAQLQALRSALPSGATFIDQGSQEPAWIGSCSDEYFHRGWSNVDYWVEFRPTVSQDQVLRDVTLAMARLGWTKTGGQWRWSRVLASGSRASASLVAPVSKTPWAISANATPAAPVGECGGG